MTEHSHFIQAISQTSATAVLYGCEECSLEFEEELSING